MFGDTIFLSAKLQLAQGEGMRDKLVQGVVQRLGGSGSAEIESALEDGFVSRSGAPRSVTAEAATASAPQDGELKEIGSFGGITQLDVDAWTPLHDRFEEA